MKITASPDLVQKYNQNNNDLNNFLSQISLKSACIYIMWPERGLIYMKKMLSILGAISLVGTSTTSLLNDNEEQVWNEFNDFTYSQRIEYLINFYIKHNKEK